MTAPKNALDITPENWLATITPILIEHPHLGLNGLNRFGKIPQAERFALLFEKNNKKHADDFNLALTFLKPFSLHWKQPEKVLALLHTVRSETKNKHLPAGIILLTAFHLGARVLHCNTTFFLEIAPPGYSLPLLPEPKPDPSCAACAGKGRVQVQQGFHTLERNCDCIRKNEAAK